MIQGNPILSLDKYKVFNLIEDVSALKVLIILESPHVDEYIHGHPAAGESALELTQFLISQGYLNDFDAQLPIGCNIKTLHYKPLGILNCSTLPMNEVFYPCTLTDDERSQVDMLVTVKQNLAQNNSNEPIDLIKTNAFQDFTSRLTQVLEQAPADIIIVPCGDTAIGFIDVFRSSYHQPLTVLDGLPHPTEADWHAKINSIRLTDLIALALLP